MKMLKRLKEEKVLILGYGREGVSTHRFIRKHFPTKQISIADKKTLNDFDDKIKAIILSDKNLEYSFGENYLRDLNKYELVFKTPGIPLKTKELIEAKKRGVIFSSQTQLFFKFCRGRIIGVTGTKGKSTTSSLINHILEASEVNSVLIGNIGKPPLDYLNKHGRSTIFVFEMSSHQLSEMNKSPNIAVFLNIFPEHADYYSNFKEYLKAKTNITKYQSSSDIFIYNADISALKDIAKTSKAQKYSFSGVEEISNGAYVKRNRIFLVEDGEELFSVKAEDIPLKGRHNLLNVSAAIIATHVCGTKSEIIKKAIKNFTPLQGRLEIVGNKNSVIFVNDTLATIPEATISAVESFDTNDITLILGGFDRGLSFEKLASNLSTRRNVENIVLIGATSKRIKSALENYKFRGKIFNIGVAPMDKIVQLALKITPLSGFVLLSPASPSFDMFKDYKDRGDQFKIAVSKL